MIGGALNLMERMLGGSLYHCCYCRLQFYDRRKMEHVAALETDTFV